MTVKALLLVDGGDTYSLPRDFEDLPQKGHRISLSKEDGEKFHAEIFKVTHHEDKGGVQITIEAKSIHPPVGWFL